MDEARRIWRARALILLSGVSFVAIALSLFSLQILRHAHFADLARENRQDQYRVPAPRGVIADRRGVELAHNVHQARLTFPRALAHPENPTLQRFAKLLDIDMATLEQRIENSNEPERVTLVRRATSAQVAVVEEHRMVLPQIQTIVGPRRHYRYGSLAAHVMGYLGEVRREEITEESHYRPGDMIGRMGVESAAEAHLRGSHGERLVEVNAAGHVVGEVKELGFPAISGSRLYLTIDRRLQARVEELLEGQVGAAVILEVGTGDLLAAASAPTYDPNEFTAGISSDRMAEILRDPRKPMFNRAFRGAYPPGSPFKLITAAAALDLGRVRPGQRFEPCFGAYRFGNRTFRCWDRGGHGSLDLEGAIVQSCDVYFYQLVQELTIDELAEAARRFGFGESTGITSFNDSPGLVPDEHWYDSNLGPGMWTAGVKLNLAIGQGELLATPLQMARSYAAIGGDGHLYQPHTVLVTETAIGNRDVRRVHRRQEPICSESTRRFLQRALLGVVIDEEGTGGLARLSKVSISGKTGTSENSAGEDHAWFVAYAPSESPDVAVAVIVENAGHGGDVAAPIVGQILEYYFALREGRDGPAPKESR